MQVLFADDDPILREFALVHLSTVEVEVAVAQHGGEALALLADKRFDLLLVDLEMPQIDGFEVLRRIRADPALKALPVMVITGREDVAAIDQAYRLGASTFFTKPINWRLLNYQILFVHRSAQAEASLRAAAPAATAPAAAVPGESRIFTAVERFAEASRSFLHEVDASGDERLSQAARRYRAAIAELASAGAGKA